MKTIIDWIENLIHYFKNVILWSSVLYRWRPWDSHFMLKVLEFNLEQIKPQIENRFEGSDKEINRINECLNCIKRLVEDNYCQAEMQAYDLKYGEAEMVFKEDSEAAGYKTIEFIRPKINELNRHQADKELKSIYQFMRQKRNRDNQVLFNTLKHWANWWH